MNDETNLSTHVVTLIRDKNQAVLRFERTDKSVNVLDEICLTQIEACLDDLEADPPHVLCLESGMPGCFIAGADLDLIAAVKDADAATKLAERGQALCRRIEVLASISIAWVHGACMGGGLEVALACDYIVAVDDKKTVLALPEIKIGIHPGFGGCVRLPKRVGWMKAVEMILSGQSLDAKRAKRIGLAALCSKPEQRDAAISYLADKGKLQKRPFSPWWLKLWPARALFFQQVEKKTYARLHGLDVASAYPAIPAVIALFKAIIVMPDGLALQREAQSLGRLAVTPSCKNLIRVFHLGEILKKQAAVKQGREAVAGFNKTAVYGAGVMGGGIAWVAAKTMAVDLHELAPDALGRGMKGITRLASRRGNVDQARLQRIRPVLDGSGLNEADVVIEAVLEDIKVKRKLWGVVGKSVSKDALLLSNTSSLSISDMQHRRANAGRIAGLHFFNPAPKMPLVEVIAGEKTSAETLHKTCALAVSWGKFPIIVADTPGFLINRCLMPFMVAALKLAEAGQKPAHIDGALKHFGMPMGAIELADRVGLDICHHVGNHLAESFGSGFAMPDWFDRMVDDGLLGEKSARGFFLYDKGKQGELNPGLAKYLASAKTSEHEFDANMGTDKAVMSTAAIIDACLVPMLLEALRCLADKVVEDPQHLDAAFVYGIGFPPFRGGLLRYFATFNDAELTQKIERLAFTVPENLEVLHAFRA
ncbi:MAG: 3-hydroxyacyl-CoA dehydrogenase NAD-binding domain-containing protein [Mariprofundus sp.]|nr:3-hydroxyacyl-CoA dehydrogenase NAD-binding domain-containing protein [Mariprofundus sp.]